MPEVTPDSGSPSAPPTPSAQELLDARAWSTGRQIRVVAILAVGVIAAVLLFWLGGSLFHKQEAAAAGPASPAGTFRASEQQLKTFIIETIAKHDFASDELTDGKIAVNADRSTPLYSPYSGRVVRVIAGLGDVVAAGAPLATVAASEYVQAQNDLATAAAQTKLARVNEARKHALFDAKGGSQQDWQQAQADLQTAEAGLQAVRNRLKIFDKSDAEIDALEKAPAIEAVATLKAPVGGVVVDRQVGPGQYLQAGGGTPAFTIADVGTVWLLANVREADAGRIKAGQSLEVHVLAYPGRVWKARISFVSAVVDPATHRVPVRASIDNADRALKPEMFANFRIVTSEATASVGVPNAAVVYEGELAHVWIIEGNGLIAYRAIKTGRHDGELVEVTDGLKPGERIVTKGGLFIDQVATPGTT
jgi:cobalt-zinc-cadmium efflux system membrane fusion protein